MDRYRKYDTKCKFFRFRFRKGKDDKYIDFLNNCPDKIGFIRRAIDQELK